MRALTRNELEYIDALIRRNSSLIKGKHPEAHKIFYQPIERPMTARERKMRQRIRRKALIMAFDLARIYAAGILPGWRDKDPFLTAKNAEVLVGRASDLIICSMITETEEEAVEAFYQILKLTGWRH
jgi:hypothetical protein